MSIRDLNWIRRRTTVHDLLDDGVENNSDIGSLLKAAEPPEQPPNPALLRKRSETLAQVKAEHSAQQELIRRRSVSWFGVVLGILIAVGGGVLTIFPVDMRVEHRRIMYLPTVWEHVTPARSRLYGSVALAFGVFLVAYSLHRPRSN